MEGTPLPIANHCFFSTLFIRYVPKSDIEWLQYKARQLPGPGQYYRPRTATDGLKGGTWGKYAPKSDVEWQMHRAAQIPGPGQYKARPLTSGAGVKFANYDPPSDIELKMKAAAEMPGPAQYAGTVSPKKKRDLNELSKAFGRVGLAMTFAAKLKKRATKAKETLAMRVMQKRMEKANEGEGGDA